MHSCDVITRLLTLESKKHSWRRIIHTSEVFCIKKKDKQILFSINYGCMNKSELYVCEVCKYNLCEHFAGFMFVWIQL